MAINVINMIEIPMTPNFIRLKGSNIPVSIAAFNDKELREIGKSWTEELIKKAHLKGDVIIK